jgi:nucleotide-binding universal stress UspA family protein
MSIDNERGGTSGASRIIVGVDGSPSSEQALRWAAEQARLTGQHVHAVIAWEFPVTYGALPVPDDVDWAEESRAILEKTVANALPETEARQVVQHVVHGAPARALLDVTEGADLLVVGCRGHGGFAGLLLGSVSQHVVTHASCPVLVVHEHADRD